MVEPSISNRQPRRRAAWLAAAAIGVLGACGDEPDEPPIDPQAGEEQAAADEPVIDELPDVVLEEPNEGPREDPGPITDLGVLDDYDDNELGGMEVALSGLTVGEVYNERAFSVTSGMQTVYVLHESGTAGTVEVGQAVSVKGRIFTDETGAPPEFRDLPAGADFYILAEEVQEG